MTIIRDILCGACGTSNTQNSLFCFECGSGMNINREEKDRFEKPTKEIVGITLSTKIPDFGPQKFPIQQPIQPMPAQANMREYDRSATISGDGSPVEGTYDRLMDRMEIKPEFQEMTGLHINSVWNNNQDQEMAMGKIKLDSHEIIDGFGLIDHIFPLNHNYYIPLKIKLPGQHYIQFEFFFSVTKSVTYKPSFGLTGYFRSRF